MAEARREPALNAPWPLLVLLAALVGAHLLRVLTGAPMERFALTSQDLAAGRLGGLVTHLFVHASWMHITMNAIFILAFGAPVARFLGEDVRGALSFWLFFLACGVAAGAGYALLAMELTRLGLASPEWALVGASGAASGLMGAAARLIEGRGRLGRMTGPTVVVFAIVWILINAGLGLTGLTPGTEGAPVAWEAHIIGFFAGVLLISPAAWSGRVHEQMTQ